MIQKEHVWQRIEQDPHHFLGLHAEGPTAKIIRLWRPGAESVHLEVAGKIQQAECLEPAGLFQIRVSAKTTPQDYRIYHQNGLLAQDPYTFLPTLGELDMHLFAKGVH